MTDTVRETLHFFRQGKSRPKSRAYAASRTAPFTAISKKPCSPAKTVKVNAFVPADAQREIAAAFKKYGFGNLTGAVESLGGKYDYGQCRLVRAALQMK